VRACHSRNNQLSVLKLEKVAKKLEEVKKERDLMLLLAQAEAFQSGKDINDVHWSDYSGCKSYYL